MPFERVLSRRHAQLALGVAAAGGAALAAGSLVALFISESGSLFGFSESGYRTVMAIAIIAEVAAIVLLARVAAASAARMASDGRKVDRRAGPSGRTWAGRGGAV